MAKRSYTNEERQTALKLYETDGPSAVEKQLGIPKGTVTGWAKAADVRTVRNENAYAHVEAAKIDNAKRRESIINRLYGVAESTLDILENPLSYETLARNSEGAERGYQPGFIPAQDKQREMTAIGIMLDKAERLEKIDNDNGATAGRSMLEKLAEQLGAMPVVDPDSGQSSAGGESAAAELPSDE